MSGFVFLYLHLVTANSHHKSLACLLRNIRKSFVCYQNPKRLFVFFHNDCKYRFRPGAMTSYCVFREMISSGNQGSQTLLPIRRHCFVLLGENKRHDEYMFDINLYSFSFHQPINNKHLFSQSNVLYILTRSNIVCSYSQLFVTQSFSLSVFITPKHSNSGFQ